MVFLTTSILQSQLKQLLEFLHCVGWAVHSMTCNLRMGVDLVVVAALVGFVTEEMYGLEVNAADIFLFLKMLQTICLVPAGRKDIK